MNPLSPEAPISFGDLLDKKFPEENVIIGSGLLHQGAILVVGGPPKTYKSFVVNSMAYHLATGTPLFEVTRSPRGGEHVPVFPIPNQKRVLVLEQEIGQRDLQNRISCMAESLLPGERDLCRQNIFYHSCDHNMRLDDPVGQMYIAKLIEAVKPDVICFDPLIEFHYQDENSASDMSKVMHGIDWLRERYPFSTIMVHHISKPSKENERVGPNQLRGSSVIFGKGDSFLLLKQIHGDDTGVLEIGFTLRRGKPIPKVTVKINFDTLMTQFVEWESTRKDHKKSRFGPVQ